MSRIGRALGLGRSIAIYHGIPGRQRRMRQFYASFVASGDLVFDVGAHAGNRARAFAALGCKVIALEPQPDFVRLLHRLYSRSPAIVIIDAAVGASVGRATLAISERTPTVTTVAADWRTARSGDPDFAGVRWDRRVEVEMTTLDALIQRFGTPRFVKIDVEGSEPAVLAGLSQPIAHLSFEYLPRALDHVDACLARLAELGEYRFNWSLGESYRLAAETWMNAPDLLAALRTPLAQSRPGDVYADLMA